MATFMGSDTSCVTGLSLIDAQVTDPNTLICQRLARRLQTPHGALASIGDDPDFGLDLRQYALGKMGPNERQAAEAAVKAECLKDEQVQSITVTTSLAAGVLTFALAGVSAAGPFALTLNVRDLTVEAVFGS